MRSLLLLLAVVTVPLHPQTAAQPAPQSSKYEGIWEGYDGEWGYVFRQLVQLAEAIPADKYTWRPAPGVRSISEVYMRSRQRTHGPADRLRPHQRHRPTLVRASVSHGKEVKVPLNKQKLHSGRLVGKIFLFCHTTLSAPVILRHA